MKKILSVISLLFLSIIVFFSLAGCGKTEFKLSFIVDSNVYYTINTNGNEVIKMPDDPVKEDYTFDGWYWDENT